MQRWPGIIALLLQVVLPAAAQSQPPNAVSEPYSIKAASHAVEFAVFVTDPSGNPVLGLEKKDFAVTDNGRPREIRIFEGSVDAPQSSPSAAKTLQGYYSNRLGLQDSSIVAAIVIDAVPRPEGIQNNPGVLAWSFKPTFGATVARGNAMSEVRQMVPGQIMAIYAACPDLRIIQDYTSDPDLLTASLRAFVVPSLPRQPGKKETPKIESFVPPMLSALREVAAKMSGASGRKSVVWLSQTYGADLHVRDISGETDATAAAFNDANVSLYAVDTRFNPTCQDPTTFGNRPQREQVGMVALRCSQPPDVSDQRMEYLARATGGRAFSGNKVIGVQGYEPESRHMWRQYRLESDRTLADEALRFAVDESRDAYELGFYVPESELDGKIHKLTVTVPGKPNLTLRYRGGYTASTTAVPSGEAHKGIATPDQVGIDARIDTVAGAKEEWRLFLALASQTVTRTGDGAIVLEATFVQTNAMGKQVAKTQETLRIPSPETQTDMVPYERPMKLTKGAVLLHIMLRDPVTNHVGSITVPIGSR